MAKHNPENASSFLERMNDAEKMEEADLLEALQPTILTVEKDDTYSTSAKLKIFSLITSLSNCAPKERKRFVKKIGRALK